MGGGVPTPLYGRWTGYGLDLAVLNRVYNFVRVCTFKYRKFINRKKFVLQVYTSDDHNAIAIKCLINLYFSRVDGKKLLS